MTTRVIPVYSIARAAQVARESQHRQKVLIGQTELGQRIWSFAGTIIVNVAERRPVHAA